MILLLPLKESSHIPVNARNTFENPEAIKELSFDKATIVYNQIQANIPPKSVVVLEIT